MLIGGAASVASSQGGPPAGVVDGIVTDTNLVALAGATVSVVGSSIYTVTGANGRFRIVGIPAGQYAVAVNRLGYARFSTVLQIAEGDTLRVSFTVQRVAAALDTVVVVGKPFSMRMTEFEEHRKTGGGQFMTQSEIEAHNSVFAKELLRTFQAVTIAMPADRAVNRRSGVARNCFFQFFLDGVAIPTPTLDTDLPSTKELAGIEVYANSATVPLRYKTTAGGGMCGVILLWTRGG